MGLESAGWFGIPQEQRESETQGESATMVQLLAARQSLCSTLDRTREVGSTLDKLQLRLYTIGDRLPPLEKAMAPLQMQSNVLKGLSSRIERAMGPAMSVLKMFDVVHTLERTLMGKPGEDFDRYLASIMQLEESLEYLKENSAVAVQWLQEAVEFLGKSGSADKYQIHRLHESLTALRAQQAGKASSGLDGGLLGIALEKLEAEFKCLVVEHSLPLSLPERVPVQTDESTAPEKSSYLFPTAVMDKLHSIMKRLAANHQAQACMDTYWEIRSSRAFVSLQALHVDYLKNSSAEAVDKIEWEELQTMIASWAQQIEVAVKVLYSRERQLASQIFGNLGQSVWVDCFCKVAHTGMSAFLKFGEGVARSQRAPEKLFKLLDMFEALENCAPSVAKVFEGEGCLEIRLRVRELQKQVVYGASKTFWEFKQWVEEQNEGPIVCDGSVTRLCSYVVNYLKYLVSEFYSPIMDQVLKIEQSWRGEGRPEERGLPHGILLFLQALERQVEDRSKEYSDLAQRHIFLMNNIWYMRTRCKKCELGVLLGETWLSEHGRKVEQHALGYQKEGWRRVLLHLSREGLLVSSGGKAVARELVRQRLRSFTAAFEDVCRRHSRWTISEDDLRDGTRLAVVQAIVPAYRSYIQSYGPLLDLGAGPNKYVKYLPEMIEQMLGDLFQGQTEKPHNGSTGHPNGDLSF